MIETTNPSTLRSRARRAKMTSSERTAEKAKYAHKRRLDLVKILSPDGTCHKCGATVGHENLEINHVHGVTFDHNSVNQHRRYARYCYPPGCAGYRLRRILGLSQHQYLALYRANLCDGTWTKSLAIARARLVLDPMAPWNIVVLLGRKVTDVFQKVALDDTTLVPFASAPCCAGMTLLSLPHPSGRQTIWNQPWARDRARQILRSLVPEIAWGTTNDDETIEVGRVDPA